MRLARTPTSAPTVIRTTKPLKRNPTQRARSPQTEVAVERRTLHVSSIGGTLSSGAQMWSASRQRALPGTRRPRDDYSPCPPVSAIETAEGVASLLLLTSARYTMEKSFCDVRDDPERGPFLQPVRMTPPPKQTSYKQSCARSNTRSDARKTLLSHRKSCPCLQSPHPRPLIPQTSEVPDSTRRTG